MAADRVYARGAGGPVAGEVTAAGPRPAGVPDLVVVGAASRDMTADDPRGWRLGGAATYTSLTAARLGIRVACLLGVDGPAGQARELDLLRDAGVTLLPVWLDHGPVFDNRDRGDRREQAWLSPSDPVPTGALPLEWRAARGWLLVPIAGELGDDWAGVPDPAAFVGVGWQGLLRTFEPDGLVHRRAPTAAPLVRRASLVVASLDDFEAGTGVSSLRGFLGPGGTLALTAGSRGGVVAGRTLLRYPAIPAGTIVDPTGAGDVFLAALTAAWLLTGEPPASPRAIRLAAAAASCSVEGPGLGGVPTLARTAARASGRG